MKKHLFLVMIAGCFSLTSFGDGLKTQLTPGGIFVGQVEPAQQVFYQKQEVMVGKDGRFVIGFGRDAELAQQYIVRDQEGREKSVTLTLESREYKVDKLTGIAKKYVTPPEKVLARIRRDATKVRKARTSKTRQYDFFEGFGWPVTGRISGVYGSQRVYNGKPGRPHYGLDVAVPTGTPVAAPASGVVRLADANLYYSGGTIIIDHGFGIFSSFLHLSKVSVQDGQTVKRGAIIGAVGATGRVTGAHLDWRYNWFNTRLDPQLLTLSRE